MRREIIDADIWRGRRVLLTGHTGFKGAWMALLLRRLGADVTGLSLAPDGAPTLFGVLAPWSKTVSVECDIRDLPSLRAVVSKVRPEIVIHMAAQALVKNAYADPVGTIGSNVLGTVHLLEVLRPIDELLGVLVITSDKVYENREAAIDFSESAALGGHDPYSASKAAAEVLTSAYRRSFFDERGIPVVTARAGNVIGGGDWARDRLVPDLWRAYETGQSAPMRNPDSVRPWQHVLDPLYGYLLYTQRSLAVPADTPASLNFGPPREPVLTVKQVAERFAKAIHARDLWVAAPAAERVHESRFLSIDSTLAFETLGWKTSLQVDDAISWTGSWYKAYHAGEDMCSFTSRQIDAYAAHVNDSALAMRVGTELA